MKMNLDKYNTFGNNYDDNLEDVEEKIDVEERCIFNEEVEDI
jgi:hypothetical protein